MTPEMLAGELATCRTDVDATRADTETIFNFARRRRPERYRPIVGGAGAGPPA